MFLEAPKVVLEQPKTSGEEELGGPDKRLFWQLILQRRLVRHFAEITTRVIRRGQDSTTRNVVGFVRYPL